MIFWHITDDPAFTIDATYKPNGPDGKPAKQAWLSLTTDPESWLASDWMTGRRYMAEVDLPDSEYNRSWAFASYAGLTEIRAWGESLARARVVRVTAIRKEGAR